jgi:uncharacterized protein (DUF885 family)
MVPVTQMEGIHLELPSLVNNARFRTVGDYESYLKRLDAVPGSIEHLIARMEVAMGAGWMPPKAAIRNGISCGQARRRHTKSAN